MNRLVEKLEINGEIFSPTSSEAKLTLNRPGRARFTVYSETPIKEGFKVVFSSGYQGKTITKWFTGFIESVIEQEGGVYRLFCREISAVYLNEMAVSLRNTTLAQVCKAYFEKTGLAFSVPDQPYATNRVPNFIHTGRAIDAIEQFGDVFGINDFVWFVQSDDSIFVGSLQDSVFNGADLPIDKSVFIALNNMEGQLALIPGLIPGFSINGKRVDEITVSGNSMVLSWLND